MKKSHSKSVNGVNCQPQKAGVMITWTNVSKADYSSQVEIGYSGRKNRLTKSSAHDEKIKKSKKSTRDHDSQTPFRRAGGLVSVLP